MKITLTAVILLTSTFAFAEDDAHHPVLPVTNSVVSTNETDSYKPSQAWAKSDARTGATRSKAKKKK